MLNTIERQIITANGTSGGVCVCRGVSHCGRLLHMHFYLTVFDQLVFCFLMRRYQWGESDNTQTQQHIQCKNKGCTYTYIYMYICLYIYIYIQTYIYTYIHSFAVASTLWLCCKLRTGYPFNFFAPGRFK